jgi:hypothetical protein
MPDVLKTLLGSKRFVAAIGAILFVLLKDRIPGVAVTEEQMIYIVGLIASWIISDGIRGLPKPSEPKV